MKIKFTYRLLGLNNEQVNVHDSPLHRSAQIQGKKFQFALRTVNIIQLAKVHPKQIFLQVIAHDLVNKEN